MNDIFLYNISDEIIQKIEYNALDKIYYLEMNVPTVQQIKNNINNNEELKLYIDNFKTIEDAINNIKKNMSIKTNNIPLYDIKTKNMYLVKDDNIYSYVVRLNYRFIDNKLIDVITIKKNKMEKNKAKIQSDPIYKRYIYKFSLILNFIKQIDINELYKTYIKFFYEKNLGKNIITCIRPSYIPYFVHLNPYYTTDEIINLSLNMELVTINDIYNNNFLLDDLCKKVIENDINAITLSNHQLYIANNNAIGLIQYYTIQGSSLMNTYLRKQTHYNYQNIYIENLINPLWELIKYSPEFDNNFIVYRFVSNDSFLRHLNINDIHVEQGFTSTTRNPFYKADLYDFGTVLMKIKIPKNIKGIALCVETYSHFPEEQEIIFPPHSCFKLISKHNNTKYYHTNKAFATQINKKYEFEWIENKSIQFDDRNMKYNKSLETIINPVKLLTAKKKASSLDDIKSNFIDTYGNNIDICILQIGDKKITTFIDKYDSIGAYKNFYAIETNNGFSLYSFYNNYLLFLIEIGNVNNEIQMHINYYTKYNKLRKDKILHDEDFTLTISCIGYYFHVSKVFIYAEYKACNNIFHSNKIERRFDNYNDINYEETIQTLSGNYCVDFYEYFKFNKKRYGILYKHNVPLSNFKQLEKYTNIFKVELFAKFSYEILNSLKYIPVFKILYKTDNDELYQIYKKTFLINNSDNIATFYVWLIDNKCHLVDIFISKIKRIFDNNNNPFINSTYIFNIAFFLYNRGYIHIYPGDDFYSIK